MRFGLIGKKLSHSYSKSFFEKYFTDNNIDAFYDNIELEKIDDIVPIFIQNRYSGFNVTNPYKIEIMKYLDVLDVRAKEVGSVNCIKLGGDKWVGYNTDIYGFDMAISPYLKSKSRALILGSGGVSRAVKYVFKTKNIPYTIVSRRGDGDTLSYEQLDKQVFDNNNVIVNATPLGTYPNVDGYPNIPYQYLCQKHLLFDLVYNPQETVFLKKGKSYGAFTVNGLDMLYYQAIKSMIIFKIKEDENTP